MDGQTLVTALKNSYGDNDDARKDAEKKLAAVRSLSTRQAFHPLFLCAQCEKEVGFYAFLLQIVTSDKFELGVRQAAVLRLKNLIGEWCACSDLNVLTSICSCAPQVQH